MLKYLKIKRFLDFIISLFAIIILSPVLLLVSIIIKIDSCGPILFKQKRYGKNKEIFYILKFRTMKIETPSDMPTNLLENADFFITRAGKFLRKSSIDELPQLFNILKGDMSLIGPRPVVINEYDLIEARDKHGINDILPGLSGWAQINGRDELTIEEKVRYDREYLENQSFWFDIKIMLFTVIKVIKKEGIVDGKKYF